MNFKKPAIFVGLWAAFQLFDAALMMMVGPTGFQTTANVIAAAVLTHFLFEDA